MISETERGQMAQAVVRIMDSWQLATADQRNLLGLAAREAHLLNRWRLGEALPLEGEVMPRVQALLAIQHALETTFPHNSAVVAYWVTTENPYFSQQTPLAAMLAGGLPTMHALCDHLNGVVSW